MFELFVAKVMDKGFLCAACSSLTLTSQSPSDHGTKLTAAAGKGSSDSAILGGSDDRRHCENLLFQLCKRTHCGAMGGGRVHGSRYLMSHTVIRAGRIRRNFSKKRGKEGRQRQRSVACESEN